MKNHSMKKFFLLEIYNNNKSKSENIMILHVCLRMRVQLDVS